MAANLLELQQMAQELNELGAMPDETLQRINARVRAREWREPIGEVQVRTGSKSKRCVIVTACLSPYWLIPWVCPLKASQNGSVIRSVQAALH